ncbi:MAG: hypothetical protein EAY75_00025, partial [Bacteroidetes bacterium]
MNNAISKALQQRWNDRVAWIKSATFSAAENAQTKQLRLAKAQKDYAYFVQTYFPHLAKKPSAFFHIKAANYLAKNTETRALFEWARGHAKSSHLSLMI